MRSATSNPTPLSQSLPSATFPAFAEPSYTSCSAAHSISALSRLAVAPNQREHGRKVENSTRHTPNSRKSSLPVTDIRSTGHVYIQDKSVDCTTGLFTERCNALRDDWKCGARQWLARWARNPDRRPHFPRFTVDRSGGGLSAVHVAALRQQASSAVDRLILHVLVSCRSDVCR